MLINFIRKCTSRNIKFLIFKIIGSSPTLSNKIGLYNQAISYSNIKGKNIFEKFDKEGNIMFIAKTFEKEFLISEKSGVTLFNHNLIYKGLSLFDGFLIKNWIKLSLKKKIIDMDGYVINLIGVHKGVHHYFHFFFDYIIPLLFYLNSDYYKGEKVSILVRKNPRNFQEEVYGTIENNFPNIKFIEIEEKMFVRVKKIIFFQHIHRFFYDNKNNKEVESSINLLRDMLLKKYNIQNLPINEKQITYVARKARLRKIINEKEFTKYIKSKNIDIKYLEKASLKDQINLFYNSKLIISVHGAAFTNLIFASKDTKFIEIFPKKYGSEDFFRISKILNLERFSYRENNEYIWQYFWLRLKKIKQIIDPIILKMTIKS